MPALDLSGSSVRRILRLNLREGPLCCLSALPRRSWGPGRLQTIQWTALRSCWSHV